MSDPYNRHDVFLDFPDLGGYAYQSQVYCPDDARDLDFGPGPWSWGDFRNSEKVPQPFTAGSVDPGTRCVVCGTLLGAEGPASDEKAR